MEKKYQIGKIEVRHIYRPGAWIDDLELKRIHNDLVKVNEKSGANVVNKMLDKNLTIEGIKNHFSNVILALFSRDGEMWSFVISPLLSSADLPVLHSGLIVAFKNPGIDIISLLAMGNLQLGYKNMKSFYTTNISSTPSIIESFVYMVPGAWPNPDVELKVIPNGYKEVVKILKEDYMDQYFPDPEKLVVNYKRFTLTSNSQEMGFVTDFYKISRSNDFRYLSFCRTWIDYSKEEDIIQVGKIDFWKNVRLSFLLWKARRTLRKAEANLAMSKEQDNQKNGNREKIKEGTSEKSEKQVTNKKTA